MDFKKINKKGSNTINGLVITMLICFAIFFVTFNYWTVNSNSAGKVVNQTYQNLNDNLTSAQADLSQEVNNIDAAWQNVTEAENTAFAVWNGMKGIGTTILAMGGLMVVSYQTYQVFMQYLNVGGTMANVLLGLVTIGIISTIAMLVIRALKGEPAVG